MILADELEVIYCADVCERMLCLALDHRKTEFIEAERFCIKEADNYSKVAFAIAQNPYNIRRGCYAK